MARDCHRSDRDGTNGVRRRSIAGDRGERRVVPLADADAIGQRDHIASPPSRLGRRGRVKRRRRANGSLSRFRERVSSTRRLAAHGADLRAKATLLRARRRRRDLSTARHVPSQRSGGRPPPPPPPPPPIASSCEALRQLRTHDVPTTRPRGDARGARVHARMTSPATSFDSLVRLASPRHAAATAARRRRRRRGREWRRWPKNFHVSCS